MELFHSTEVQRHQSGGQRYGGHCYKKGMISLWPQGKKILFTQLSLLACAVQLFELLCRKLMTITSVLGWLKIASQDCLRKRTTSPFSVNQECRFELVQQLPQTCTTSWRRSSVVTISTVVMTSLPLWTNLWRFKMSNSTINLPITPCTTQTSLQHCWFFNKTYQNTCKMPFVMAFSAFSVLWLANMSLGLGLYRCLLVWNALDSASVEFLYFILYQCFFSYNVNIMKKEKKNILDTYVHVHWA